MDNRAGRVERLSLIPTGVKNRRQLPARDAAREHIADERRVNPAGSIELRVTSATRTSPVLRPWNTVRQHPPPRQPFNPASGTDPHTRTGLRRLRRQSAACVRLFLIQLKHDGNVLHGGNSRIVTHGSGTAHEDQTVGDDVSEFIVGLVFRLVQ